MSSTQTIVSKRISHRRHLRQRGFGILSALLALVIFAVGASVVFSQYLDSQRKTRIDAATSEITTMIADAQKVYGTTGQYGAVTTAVAVQGGVVPERLRIAGTNTAQNRYNGAITFTPATLTSTSDSLTLGYNNVRKSDCQDVVLTTQALFRRIMVGGETVKPADGAIDVAALATACDSADSQDLAFTFGRH